MEMRSSQRSNGRMVLLRKSFHLDGIVNRSINQSLGTPPSILRISSLVVRKLLNSFAPPTGALMSKKL